MASAKCVYCIIKFRKKQIPHTTKEVNHSRTQRTARTCRRRSALSKNTSAFVRFRCAFAAFIYCFLCGCVRARVAYLCWSWVEFFHTFCTNTEAELLPRLIALRRLLTFSLFLPLVFCLFVPDGSMLYCWISSSIRKCNNLVAKFRHSSSQRLTFGQVARFFTALLC